MVVHGCFNESSKTVKFNRNEITVRPYPFQLRDYHLDFASYLAQIVINFPNGSRIVNVLVKILPKDCTEPVFALALNGFHNEKFFWKKVSVDVGRELLPKFYAAEMKKYGRPVIVVEDLEMNGFRRPMNPNKLSVEETMKVLEYVGKLHGRGMALKKVDPSEYRKIRNGFKEVVLDKSEKARTLQELSRLVAYLYCLLIFISHY